ncbi:MAG TPA: phosphatase PAP2 family protein [Clostridiaceae bacterium]|nr:phosphatase PAP2 family protein [Clostridiaceae bacterium]
MSQWITTVDFKILDILQGMRQPFLDYIMAVITHIGDAGALWIFVAIYFLIFYKRDRRIGIAMAIALIFTLLSVNLGIKLIVQRTRPFELAAMHGHVVDTFIKPPIDTSFPSGHTTASFAGATPLIFLKHKFALPALIAAILISFSRLYFAVHYPSDVFIGVLLGTLLGWVGTLIARNFMYRWRLHQRSRDLDC